MGNSGSQSSPQTRSSSKVATFWFTKIVVPWRCERVHLAPSTPPRALRHRHLPGTSLRSKMDTLEERWETAGAKAPAQTRSSSKVATFWFTKIVVPGRCERVPGRCERVPGRCERVARGRGNQETRATKSKLLQNPYLYPLFQTWGAASRKAAENTPLIRHDGGQIGTCPDNPGKGKY